MNSEQIKRYSIVEITLLAVFAMGLFCAYLVVKARGRVIVSEPIPLAGSGLSVSIPAGTGWEYTGSWQFESDNTATLLAGRQGLRGPDVQIRWRYHLSAPAEIAAAQLEHYAQQTKSAIQEIKTTAGPHPMSYGWLFSMSGDGGAFIVGVLSLEYGKSIELQVRSVHVDQSAEELFLALADSIVYEAPPERGRGQALLDAYMAGLFIPGNGRNEFEDAFLIKDDRNRNIGYYSFQKSCYSEDPNLLCRFQATMFEAGAGRTESVLWLRNQGDTMFWKSNDYYPNIKGPKSFEIRINANNQVEVNSNVDKPVVFNREYTLLPELLAEEFSQYFLHDADEQVFVDVLTRNGRILPVCLSKMPAEMRPKFEGAAGGVRLEYQAMDAYEELYFDTNDRLLGKHIKTSLNRIRRWDVSMPQQLQDIFKQYYQPSAEQTVHAIVNRP